MSTSLNTTQFGRLPSLNSKQLNRFQKNLFNWSRGHALQTAQQHGGATEVQELLMIYAAEDFLKPVFKVHTFFNQTLPTFFKKHNPFK